MHFERLMWRFLQWITGWHRVFRWRKSEWCGEKGVRLVRWLLDRALIIFEDVELSIENGMRHSHQAYLISFRPSGYQWGVAETTGMPVWIAGILSALHIQSDRRANSWVRTRGNNTSEVFLDLTVIFQNSKYHFVRNSLLVFCCRVQFSKLIVSFQRICFHSILQISLW